MFRGGSRIACVFLSPGKTFRGVVHTLFQVFKCKCSATRYKSFSIAISCAKKRETPRRTFPIYGTCLNVTGFGKTDHIVTIDISRNTDLKY